MQQLIDAALVQDAREREDTIRWLLRRWVSELAPAVALDAAGQIIGLCAANTPLGGRGVDLPLWVEA